MHYRLNGNGKRENTGNGMVYGINGKHVNQNSGQMNKRMNERTEKAESNQRLEASPPVQKKEVILVVADVRLRHNVIILSVTSTAYARMHYRIDQILHASHQYVCVCACNAFRCMNGNNNNSNKT